MDIENISNDTCGKLIANIHEQVFFSRKVYCRGLKNLETPTKIAPEEKSKDTTDNTSKPDPDTKIDDSKDATADKDDIETIENKKDSLPPLVPGLSKEEAAKAAKKARQHKNKLDKQKGAKNIGKKSKDLDKSDFLNDSNPQPSPEFDQTSAYVFEDDPESPLTETSDAASKFFQHSPLSTDDPIFLTPGSYSSLTAKKIQKEELWKQQISPKPANKRSSSPSEDLERRMRSRSVSTSSRIPMTSKLPFVNTAK